MSGESSYELRQRGQQHLNKGEYHLALSCCQEALDIAQRERDLNGQMDALSGLAVAWANLGETQRYIESSTRLLAAARRADNKKYEVVAGLRLADGLAIVDLRGRWSEIRPLLLDGLQTARQLGDNFWIVYHLMQLGDNALNVGETDAGYGWLQDALNALTPDTESAPFFRYRIYESLSNWAWGQGDRAEALRYAEMALGAARERGNPDFVAHAQLRLARVQRWRGELNEALELTEEALATWRRLNVEFRIAEATALKVQLLVDLGLRDEAQATYRELLASGIKGGSSYNTIGLRAYKDLHDLDGAERAYRLCLEQEPRHASAWNNLAYVLYDKDEIDEAVRYWRESLKLRNENADALAGLALGLWTQGRRDEALRIFRQALDLEPRYADPAWLPDEPFWSQKAVAAARSLIVAAKAPSPDHNTGDIP